MTAFVSPTAAGHIETQVFNASSGKRVSTEPERSRRYVGWSAGGGRSFPYNAEVMVLVSGWSSSYKARFELWHTAADVTRTQLGETNVGGERVRSVDADEIPRTRPPNPSLYPAAAIERELW